MMIADVRCESRHHGLSPVEQTLHLTRFQELKSWGGENFPPNIARVVAELAETICRNVVAADL